MLVGSDDDKDRPVNVINNNGKVTSKSNWCEEEPNKKRGVGVVLEVSTHKVRKRGSVVAVKRVLNWSERFFDWWEHSRLKKFGIGLGRLLMWIDIITDSIVAYDLYRTQQSPYLWVMALVFLVLQYVVIWMVLLKPVRKLVREGQFGKFVIPAAASWPLFIFCYTVIGMPCILCLDILLVTNYLCDELEGKSFISKDFLVYYERMRVLCECLLEALPEAIFQVSIWRAGILSGDDDSSSFGGLSPSEALFVSVGITMVSLLKCLYLVYDGAVQRGVSPWTHARQIVNLGIGFTPYLSGVRKGKLQEVNYDKVILTEGDVDKIMKAAHSKKTKLLRLSMHDCELTDSCARKIADGIAKCKTLTTIDVRGNTGIQTSGRLALGNALLDASQSKLKHWQCDAVSLSPADTTLELSSGQLKRRQSVQKQKPSRKKSNKQVEFGLAEVTLIAGLLKWNDRLTALDIDANKVGDDGKVRLARALCESTCSAVQSIIVRQLRGGWEVEHGSSRILDLSYHGLGPSDCALLAGIVKVNSTISCLNLTNNQLCGSTIFEKPSTTGTPRGKLLSGKTISIKHTIRRQQSKKVLPLKQKDESHHQNAASHRQQDLSGLKLLCDSLSGCLPSQQLMKKKAVLNNEGSPSKGLASRGSITNESSSALVRRASFTKALGFASEVYVSPSHKHQRASVGCERGFQPSTITQLVLNHNALSGDALEVIVDMLATNSTITELNLKGNRINSANKKAMSKVLFANRHSRIGAFSCTEWGVPSGTTRLDLSKSKTNRCLGPDDISLLAAVILRNPSLTELNLSANNVAGTTYEGGRWTSSNLDGVVALGKMLKRNRQVVNLDLSDNRMGPSGVKIIAGSLEWTPSEIEEDKDPFASLPVLKCLGLKGNMIWGEGVTAIVTMLKKQTAASQVCLPVKSEVGEVGTSSTSAGQLGLVELDLSDNNKIQDEQRQLLKEWGLAAGVALNLESPKSTTVSPVHSRKVSNTGLSNPFSLTRPSSAGPSRKGKFRGPNRRNSSQLLKVAKQRQRTLEE